MSKVPVFEFGINPKQDSFFEAVMKAGAGITDVRRFAYGGAIRGGKTSVCLVTLWMLARKYPGSRWHVIRDSFTVLEATTIPSMEKFVPPHAKSVQRYNRSSSNFFVELTNGSRIFFVSESYYSDPNLTWMLGLETNGIFLEQAEGLQLATWNKALERVGSWYVDPMPPAIILTTFNPTLNWPKDIFRDPSVKGTLPKDHLFVEALPSDNPKVTQDQWNAWKTMDELSYQRFVEGSWAAFAVDKPFAYGFDHTKNTCGRGKPRRDLDVWLSFDFNTDPITCLVCQHADDRSWDRVLAEYRIGRSDIYELCTRIVADYGGYNLVVTGDASGMSTSAMVPDKLNYYKIIKEKLNLTDRDFKVPSSNPGVKGSRIQLNSILQRHPNFKISSHLKYLIEDLRFVEVDGKGEINKQKDKRRTHLLDCLRYYLNIVYPDFVKVELPKG